VAGAYAEWLQRGVAHKKAGRPIEAVLSFSRAIASSTGPAGHGAADARFRLGETLWQLGLVDDAIASWRNAAHADAHGLAPRLALAEALLTRGDFVGALSVAAEALVIAPEDLRAQASHSAAAAALGDPVGADAIARLLSARPELALLPSYAPALAKALVRAPRAAAADSLPESIHDFVGKLVPLAADMPAVLLAPVVAEAFARHRAILAEALRARAWVGGDIDPLRRIIVAIHPHDPALASELAATHAAMCVAEPLLVPSLWPARTGGASLRLAWLMPAPDSPMFASARATLAETAKDLGGSDTDISVLCIGSPEATRAAIAAPDDGSRILAGPHSAASFAAIAKPVSISVSRYLRLPPQPDATHARGLAGSDPDVLVDLAGLNAATGLFLAARPARHVWSLRTVLPGHAPALIERTFDTAGELARELCALQAGGFPPAHSAQELGSWWDAAVRAHQHGDANAAADGYARVLAAQPDYAPAHRLAAVLARERGEQDLAESEFATAVALAPDDSDTRIAAARLALAMHRPERAATLLRAGLDRTPFRAPLWLALGDAELARRDGDAAARAFEQALRLVPADGQIYFNLGVAMQMRGALQEAAEAYQRAAILRPDFTSAFFNLGVVFQEQGRAEAAGAAYRQALALNPKDAAAYKNLGEVLFASGSIDAWIANFRAFESHCPTALPLAVQALEVCQLTADHARLDRYLDGLRREQFPATGELELVDALEELLFLLLNFDVEPEMLQRFSATYDSAASHVYGTPGTLCAPQVPRRPGKLRIGYLSGDLRDHVMGKQMWQAVARHDRDRFDLHFYSTSVARDAWTERFAGLADRFEVVARLGDAEAAALICGDDLDLLVDLSTHTKGARPGILALKPARVQVTHVASCGTVGLTAIDYKLTDHFADLPENQDFMLETLLPMDGCVYPWRMVAPAATHPFTRLALGIAPDTFVIGAFVSPLKLSRRCMALWRDVLERVPRAKLAFSPNNAAQRPLYARIAAAAGIAADRLLFLPQGRDEHENQSRYEVVDVVLDTLPYGGVNGTMEALGMGVPVVTLVGKRHGERSTYSILANLGVLETVAHGGREYADIAERLATDAAFMAQVRESIRAQIGHSALTDAVAHTRNLEAAYLRALQEKAPDAVAGAG
jgi:predicted O-linked N-acetylglucosamine transferase (SPINDLY family)